ncbi:MAG: leucine-rich repeat protein, partial [Clostridiaceae bacterium]|nr:leucine-rich repeat protein [Clostridiaceae bacterium]
MMEFEFEEKNGIIYITRYKGTQNAVVIPYEIDGIYRKVVIAADAFKDCNIKEITIHDGFRLRDIDFLDFCDDLERINVNHYGVRDYTPYKDIDGVLYTDEWQRWSPDSSPGWSPESLKWLTGGDRTSLQRGLTLVWFPQGRRGSYAIPEGVVDVRRFAAGTKCPSLSEITIPASLEDIDAILVYCDNLERINVASENPKYKDIDGVLFRKDGKRLVLFPWQSETNSYIVPDGEDLAV